MNQSMKNEEKRQFYMDHIYSHRKDMYRILWSMFGDPDIVEEIAQGVLEHAWKGLDTLKDQNKSWAWLKGILRNESRTHIRKKEEWENKKIQLAENQGIKKANEDLVIKRIESQNARKMITEIFQMLSEENISHNAYYNRIMNRNNLSKQAKREKYLKNRMRGNIDWGLER